MMFLVSAALALNALWQPIHPGVWVREAQMAAEGPLAPVRVIIVRLEPARVQFSLDTGTGERDRAGWSVEQLPQFGIAGFNAGQFYGGTPWGWLVQDGIEVQPPGQGSTAMSFVLDRSGAVALVEPSELRAAQKNAWLAFQSYPALLVGVRSLPWELQAPGRGVDLTHRDSRLALGVLADRSVVVALTRFSGLGQGAETLPWGPTVVEMAEFMRDLGCVRAMLLDGGLSSQMALRGAEGSVRRWTNWRTVPLGLVVTPKSGVERAPDQPALR